MNYPPREVSYIHGLDQLNLPLDFRRQMHDLVLLFKYKTGPVTSNFGHLIQTATRHYRTPYFHEANFDLLSTPDSVITSLGHYQSANQFISTDNRAPVAQLVLK